MRTRTTVVTPRLAMDRASSARSYDRDGRLHVAVTNISKATVNGYLGSEIPGSEALGLQPDRVYQLLRHPDELEKAVGTFNNLPVLSEHVPVTVNDPRQDLIIGSTGTNAAFDAPYLKNSLVIWTADAIVGIITEEKYEISSAYRYVPVMEPGEYDGVAFDGVMTDIVGNHVAIVEVGRAGSDVVVADHHPEFLKMAKKKLSRRALAVRAALTGYLQPKIAQDKKMPDLTPIIAGVTAKNYRTGTASLVQAVTVCVTPELAQDADLDGLAKLVETFSDDPDTADDDAAAPMPMPPPGAAKPIAGDSPTSAIMSFLRGKLSDEDAAKLGEMLEQMVSPPPAAMDEDDEDKIDKAAMDAAITSARAETVKEMTAIREAEREVRPLVGELAVVCDSAEKVYQTALKLRGVDLTDVPPAAYRSLVRMQLTAPAKPTIAADSDPKPITERFPHLTRLSRA